MAPQDHGQTETSRLLQNTDHDEEETDHESDLLRAELASESSRVAPRDCISHYLGDQAVLYLCGLFVLLVSFPMFMNQAAKIRMLELGICRDYYSQTQPNVIDHRGNIAEHLCKIPEVQKQLARSRGLLSVLESIPGLFLAIPYGMLADLRGRRLLIALSLVGSMSADLFTFLVLFFYRVFPFGAVFIAPIFTLVGGGLMTMTAGLLAMVGCAVHESMRTQAFLTMQIALFVTELLAPPSGSLLMKLVGPHFAFMIGVPMEAVGFIILFFVPERQHERTKPVPGPTDTLDPEELGDRTATSPNRSTKKDLAAAVMSTARGLREMLSTRVIAVGLASAAVQKLTRPIMDVTLQYMSVKFGWPLKKSNILLSLKAGVQFPVFVFVMPFAYKMLERKSTPSAANLNLSRITVLARLGGCLGMGFAQTEASFLVSMAVWALGAGYGAVIRSYITSFVPKARLTTLYTTMSVFDGISLMTSTPLLAFAFSIGLGYDNVLMGLPYFAAVAMYGMGAVGVCFMLRSNEEAHLEE